MTWAHSGIQSRGVDEGSSIKFSDSASVDAYFRARASNPFTLFNHKQIWDDPDLANNAENFPLFFDNQETSGSGTTTTFNINRASTTLAVSAFTPGTRVRQTKQRFNYVGKSQMVYFSCVPGDTAQGVTKKIGLFDENNGIFLESKGGKLSLVVRSSITGTSIDELTPQTSWDDSLNADGQSGREIDPANAQLFFFDYQWPIGRIRWGIFFGGTPLYFDDIISANLSQSSYMSTPNLPFRMEISNDGTGIADSFECMSVTIITEGGVQPDGVLRFDDVGVNPISASTNGMTYAICGICLKPEYLSARVREIFSSLIENSGGNNPFLWRLHLNPILTTGLTFSDVPNSPVKFGTGIASGDVILDDGIVVAGSYQAKQDSNASAQLESALPLGSTINGTPDQLVLSGTPLSMNQLFLGGLQWMEAW